MHEEGGVLVEAAARCVGDALDYATYFTVYLHLTVCCLCGRGSILKSTLGFSRSDG